MTDPGHSRRVVVWGVPPGVVSGEQFSARVGIRCEAACRPDGWSLEIRDHTGETLASVIPRDEPWPETEALYGNEVALRAPASAGEFRWEVVAPGIEGAVGNADEPASNHAEAGVALALRVLPRPHGRLNVVAIDRESQAPVPGARIFVHPFAAVTDAQGVASLELPAGPYRLFVTGRSFLPLRIDGELADGAPEHAATVRAELERDREPSAAERWS